MGLKLKTMSTMSTRRPPLNVTGVLLVILSVIFFTRELSRSWVSQSGPDGTCSSNASGKSSNSIATSRTVVPNYDHFNQDETMDDDLRELLKVKESQGTAKEMAAHKRDPRVCVLIRAYRKQYSYLPVLLTALAHGGQAPGKVSAFVIDTENEAGDALEKILEWHNSMISQPSFSRVLHFTGAASNSSRPDWGYAMTDKALAFFKRKLLQPEESKEGDNLECDYLLFTNGDNFYSTGWYKVLLPFMKAQKDLIASDFISRYQAWHRVDPRADNKYVFDDASRKVFNISWQVGDIDLGCIFFNLRFMVRQKLWFRSSAVDGYTEESDGELAVKARRKTKNHAITRQVLFVHQ